jgi:anti-anti-sigma factor
MAPFQLVRHENVDPDLVVVEIAGELDLTNAAELEERLEVLVPPRAALVLDLNRVVFIDSAAVHALFRLARARGRHGLVIVVEATAQIARTLGIVDLERAVTVEPSLDDARASLARAQRDRAHVSRAPGGG